MNRSSTQERPTVSEATVLAPILGLAFQPVFAINEAPGSVVAFESLLRVTENGVTTGPVDLVAAAERDGSIVDIDRWVLEEVIRLASTRPRLNVWMNVSQLSIGHPTFLDEALTSLTASHTISRIAFEITETADVEAYLLAKRLEAKRVKTLTVLIDDIRDGYAKRSLLMTDGVAGCKLSRETTVELKDSERVRAEVQQLVKLCRACGKKVVLEGVETLDDLMLAMKLGISLCQGYHFGYPAYPDELQNFAAMVPTE